MIATTLLSTTTTMTGDDSPLSIAIQILVVFASVLLITAFIYRLANVVHLQQNYFHTECYRPETTREGSTSSIRFNHDTGIYDERDGIPLDELPQRPPPSRTRQVHFEIPPLPTIPPPSPSIESTNSLHVPPSIYKSDRHSMTNGSSSPWTRLLSLPLSTIDECSSIPRQPPYNHTPSSLCELIDSFQVHDQEGLEEVGEEEV